ncbi:MAG: hypothetical protein AAF216_11095 [Pseudomonadota bacterium]
MINLKLTASAVAGLLALTACSAHTQSTSGASYIARYDNYKADFAKADGAHGDVDADVMRIAQIEPQLEFPARIGLARIQWGQLQTIPADEAAIWQKMAEQIGPEMGDFIPVSPLIAEMVAEPRAPGRSSAANVIADVRRGAARQHLDYVLIYEVGTSKRERANDIAVADLTIIGMFVLPTRGVEVEASASAILLDVRNGYPYATLTGHAEENGHARVIDTSSRLVELAETAEARAVADLADAADEAFDQLVQAAAAS